MRTSIGARGLCFPLGGGSWSSALSSGAVTRSSGVLSPLGTCHESSILLSAVSLPGTLPCPGFVSADGFRLLETPVVNDVASLNKKIKEFGGEIKNDELAFPALMN